VASLTSLEISGQLNFTFLAYCGSFFIMRRRKCNTSNVESQLYSAISYSALLVSTECEPVFSCFSAANRMIYSANHPVLLYQLVVTDFICWLPVNTTEFCDWISRDLRKSTVIQQLLLNQLEWHDAAKRHVHPFIMSHCLCIKLAYS
jgi:hypothetical protein